MLWHAEQMFPWWICSKSDIIPTWQGQMRMCVFLANRLAMYCMLFVCDPKVSCGGFDWVNNQWRDLIIWPNRSDQFQREQRRLCPGYQVLCASFFCRCRWEVTQPPCLNWHSQHTHECMSQRQVWQRCPWRNGNADKQQQQPTNWSSRVFKTDPSSGTTDWSKKLHHD